jgi:hypothetical protein
MDSLWKPTGIYCEDSLLILVDNTTDCFVQIYHKDNLDKIAENIPRGIGPDERLNCWTLQMDSEYVWAFDMQLRKLTAYEKKDFYTESKIKPEKAVDFLEWPIAVVSLRNEKFVASCLTDETNLLSVFDENANRDTTLSVDYPKLKHESIPDFLKKRSFENRIFYDYRSNKIVVFYVYTDIIDVYDDELKLIARIQGPDRFVPELKRENNHVSAIKNRTRIGYLNGAVTPSEIWALYYGIYPEPGKDLQNRIFVFDYNGKPLRFYELEYPVFNFCIDEKNRLLYGLTENPEISVVKFKY